MMILRGKWLLSIASVGFVSVGIGCGSATPPAEAPPSLAKAPSEEAPPKPAPEPAASRELLLGIKAFDAKDYAGARASFEAAAKKNPQNYEAFLNLGLACEKLSDSSAAEAAYKSALVIKPNLDSATAELSALYIDEGRPDDAVTVARAGLTAHPASGALHENLGVALATRADQEAAAKELEQAAKLAPNEPMFQLTFAHWLNVWHTEGAAPHLESVLRLASDDYGMLASVGYEYRMAGAFPACIKTFEKAIAIRDGGEVRTERALCHHGLKEDAAATDDLKAAVAVEPSYAPAHFYLAGRLASTKDFKQAATEYAKYLQLAPNGSLAKAAAERMTAAQDAAKERTKKK